jgi:hypothetical protein
MRPPYPEHRSQNTYRQWIHTQIDRPPFSGVQRGYASGGTKPFRPAITAAERARVIDIYPSEIQSLAALLHRDLYASMQTTRPNLTTRQCPAPPAKMDYPCSLQCL